MSALTSIVQIGSISTSLVASGAIAALSLFDVPLLQSQPADRALPSIRWLFSRGSHIFPTAAFVSSAGFAYLAAASYPLDRGSIVQALRSKQGFKVGGYAAAATLAIGIAAFTGLIMLPNNFALIEHNERKGGARSSESAKAMQNHGSRSTQRSAEDSVNSKDDIDEFSDLSGAQTKTRWASTEAEDEEVKVMLGKFARQNFARAVLMGAAGIVGIMTTLM